MTTFKLNEQVPDFTLPSVTGEQITFSDTKGSDEWQLIIYFRGSWCPVCQEELEDIESSISYFEKHNIRVTAISHDNKNDLQKLIDDKGLSFSILMDEDYSFLEAYGVHRHTNDAPYEDHGDHGEPAYFLTDENGKLLYQQRQTSPFGRPHVNELRKIIKYIRKNLT
ncbi:redoxin domain-containing protein [Paenalkalicoccus suaedae]|uniref:Redoxin domain-containing protein n=1 Tax=Paenalkalicoccus suaedae TaxID=2592382 RepID=A0A859FH95_9BACI|nr:redoxin domain-containing protein [Paenalkalicoccus suaedae]QKS72489.1 redoxin domain-containing protein [Paenalkalicoccus suaedae]